MDPGHKFQHTLGVSDGFLGETKICWSCQYCAFGGSWLSFVLFSLGRGEKKGGGCLRSKIKKIQVRVVFLFSPCPEKIFETSWTEMIVVLAILFHSLTTLNVQPTYSEASQVNFAKCIRIEHPRELKSHIVSAFHHWAVESKCHSYSNHFF